MGTVLRIYDPSDWEPYDESTQPEAEASLAELKKTVAEQGGRVDMAMPEVCAGSEVGWWLAMGTHTLTVTGLISLGWKIVDFVRKRNAKRRSAKASGDIEAMKAVALYIVNQEVEGFETDLALVQALGSDAKDPPYAYPFVGVYLYRIPDLVHRRTHLVEVGAEATLISHTVRDGIEWTQAVADCYESEGA